FSLLVEATVRLLGPTAFYFEYALILGLYVISLRTIVSAAGILPGGGRTRAAFAVAVIALHSAALRFVLRRALGPDWEFVLEGGVAGQRLLGAVFQPSVFGVFLLSSVAAFLRRRPLLAAACAAIAATFHPTYLLAAAVLVLAYAGWTAWKGAGWRSAAAIAVLALVLVVPILIYTLRNFSPTGPDLSRLAQAALVERIPHHAVPAQWLNASVRVQMAILISALALARRTPLFPLLAAPAAVSLALSLIQVITASPALALLFPWRLSTVLIPASTAVLLARGVTGVAPHLERWRGTLLGLLAAGVLVPLALAGGARFAIEVDQMRRDPARPMFEFVAGRRNAGEVYLVPPKEEAFRLTTGAPIVVDSKSIPYHDVEVLEWSERLRLARFFYRDRVGDIDCGVLEEIRLSYRATHVVLGPDQLGLDCGPWVELYRDEAYAVYRLPEP
ncbi:MAG: DUF6798 domain-containing protein, partial [Anaerolineales bacterium]